MTVQELKDFESEVSELFKQGKIRCPIHLSGGNEQQLIDIFQNIMSRDYVFSTHRNHLHYLLHTGDREGLMRRILEGDSMHTCCQKSTFYSSSIVSGCVAIACGVAYAIKQIGSPQKVWCFIGDAGTDEGWFQEAVKYAICQDLPITYIIENNDRSVCSTIKDRWGWDLEFKTHDKVLYYDYTCSYPHAGVGVFVDLEGNKNSK